MARNDNARVPHHPVGAFRRADDGASTHPISIADGDHCERPGIAVVAFVLLLTTKLDTLWIILGAAVISLSASSLGLVLYL